MRASHWLGPALAAFVASCTPRYYQAGTIADQVPSHATRVIGCVELGFQVKQRAEATGPVLVVSIGNRCRNVTRLDLSALRVTAHAVDQTTAMAAYDPRRELGPRWLGSRCFGQEWIEYHYASDDPSPRPSYFEVSLAGVVPDGDQRRERDDRVVVHW
jgi:hypothetical protein